MDIDQFFENMKIIQMKLFELIENEEDIEENYENFRNILSEQKIFTDRENFKLILQLISKIGKNHIRTSNFISKIKKILIFLKNEIKQTFSNFDIFDIFKNNKLFLLFLYQENFIYFDHTISDIMTRRNCYCMKYPAYFYNEIKPFINEEEMKRYTIEDSPDKYEEKRQIGENDSYISKLIREDLIDEFISYVNQNDISPKSYIPRSIYETNLLLCRDKISLIEYSAFFGSVQIFKYLYFNHADISNYIWIFAVHSDNPELISFLEENKITPINGKYERCLEESVKCYHNDVIRYILDNYINEIDKREFDKNIDAYSLKYRHFLFCPKVSKCPYFLYYVCEYNYVNVVISYLQNNKICTKSFIVLNNRSFIKFYISFLIKF